MGLGANEVGHDDPEVGVLLTMAGWTGGGVVAGMCFQALRTPDGVARFPTAHPLDAFLAVVAGCFLVGPVVAGALLWRWRQPRAVQTVATLCGVGIFAVVPLMVPVGVLVQHGAALVGILLFIGGWGIALPAGARLLVDRQADGGIVARAGGSLFRPLPTSTMATHAPLGGSAWPTPDAAPVGWMPAPTPSPWTAPAPQVAPGAPEPWIHAAPAVPPVPPSSTAEPVRPGPPVDPSLPPIVLPPEVGGP